MRFTTILLTGLAAALASAQTTESTTVTTPTTLSTSTTADEAPAETSQSEITKCIDACTPGDVGCTAKCIAVPNPDPAAVNATNDCVAACPKGNGTAADNLAYQECVDACIGKYYFTATTGSPTGGTSPQPTGTGTGVVVVTTTDGSGATVTSTSTSRGAGTTGGAGNGGSGTSGSAAPTATGNGAVRNGMGMGAAVGLVGVVAGMVVL
ncbi:hypothetical protein GE09DRAFT_418123 [Coniochaeta sp. 2T2.1]|nr:hypothetical protein GE09DRAFT_418123 [Coniochaeta sp. 2T2.1]